MNKRQKKKRNTIIGNRVGFFNRHIIFSGRMNGKAACYNTIIKACWSKKYKPFNRLKKLYQKMFISIDFGSRKDYTAEILYKIKKGIIEITGTRIIR